MCMYGECDIHINCINEIGRVWPSGSKSLRWLQWFNVHCHVNMCCCKRGITCTFITTMLRLNKTQWPLSTEATLSKVAKNFRRCYYECIYFSLSPKATSLMRPQFLGKEGCLIRGGLLYLEIYVCYLNVGKIVHRILFYYCLCVILSLRVHFFLEIYIGII